MSDEFEDYKITNIKDEYGPYKLGETLRIRLPNDWTPEGAKFPLDDSKTTITSKEWNEVMSRMAIEATDAMIVRTLKPLPFIPLTQKQKLKRRLKDLKQRCKDIWTIVSGGDIHENCDY